MTGSTHRRAPRTPARTRLDAAAALRRRLLGHARELGADELRVLLATAERLRRGRVEYGELRVATDARNWMREAAEELLDAAIYRRIADTLREGGA